MRPTKDQWALDMVNVTALRSTCLRRQVGCVLLDERGHVLATGYNGVASGLPHCNELVRVGANYKDEGGGISIPRKIVDSYPNACPGATAPSGTNLDGCEAIHAEQNALLQCQDVHSIHTCYSSASPCVTCVKLLLNTSCQCIVFLELYPHPQAKLLWEKAGRLWEHFK